MEQGLNFEVTQILDILGDGLRKDETDKPSVRYPEYP